MELETTVSQAQKTNVSCVTSCGKSTFEYLVFVRNQTVQCEEHKTLTRTKRRRQESRGKTTKYHLISRRQHVCI